MLTSISFRDELGVLFDVIKISSQLKMKVHKVLGPIMVFHGWKFPSVK